MLSLQTEFHGHWWHGVLNVALFKYFLNILLYGMIFSGCQLINDIELHCIEMINDIEHHFNKHVLELVTGWNLHLSGRLGTFNRGGWSQKLWGSETFNMTVKGNLEDFFHHQGDLQILNEHPGKKMWKMMNLAIVVIKDAKLKRGWKANFI